MLPYYDIIVFLSLFEKNLQYFPYSFQEYFTFIRNLFSYYFIIILSLPFNILQPPLNFFILFFPYSSFFLFFPYISEFWKNWNFPQFDN